MKDDRNVYNGVSGLQDAVIRFLIMVCESKGQEMLLYSDQDMAWMMGPEDFCLKWAMLMKYCVKSGIRIRIIHNIDRSPREMDMAIKSWLPLYMSGMVEPYYSEAVKDVRFFHTLFVCPGVAAIEASPGGSCH